MRTAIALLMLIFVSFQAQAYDEDTHFYGTYAMARYAGIKHEVATKIALSAQWMDESFLSDPMSLAFPAFVSGVKKRRLLHFPADRYVGKMNALAQRHTYNLTFEDVPAPLQELIKKIAEQVNFDIKNFDRMTILTEVEKDHRLATQLLKLGLENGNLMQASASLHVLEDSYAHAGTPAGEGHRNGWHWPDRPFSNPEKYFEMTDSVFQALAAIRLMLPTSALDCSLATTKTGMPNCMTAAADLQAAYAANEDIQKTVRLNVLKNPEYVRETMKSVFTIAAHKNIGYVNMNAQQIDDLIDQAGIDGSKNAYDTLRSMVIKMTENYLKNGDASLNVYAMIADIYQLKNPDAEQVQEFIRNFGVEDGLLLRTDSAAFQKFAAHLSRSLLRWYVPREMNNDDHKQESEVDKDIVLSKGQVVRSPRNIEMEIRVRNMQALIQRMFGIEIEMIPNNSKDDVGFAHEVWMSAEAIPKPVAKPRPGVVYVTFDLAEKNRWDYMIFNYLYPSLKDQDLKTLVNIGALIKETITRVSEILAPGEGAKPSWMPFPIRAAGEAMAEVGELRNIKDLFSPFALAWLTDLSTELVTTENYRYHSVNFLTKSKQSGAIKPFLTDNDTWNEALLFNNPKTKTAKVQE